MEANNFYTEAGKLLHLEVAGMGVKSALIEFQLQTDSEVFSFVVFADPEGPNADYGAMPQVYAGMAAILAIALASQLKIKVEYKINGDKQLVCRKVRLEK
jgi:hypothetical protein